MIRIRLLLFAVVLLFLQISGAVFADNFDNGGYQFEQIEDFNVDIVVNEDGSMDVVEKILYNFGSEVRHGIIRNIPLLYGDGVDEVSIDFEVEKVTNESGDPYLYDAYEGYYDLEVKVGDALEYVSGKKWYYIYYSADNVLNGFESSDELYWNVTGTEWSVPINSVSVDVVVPPGPQERMVSTCYSGFFGDAYVDCEAEVVSNKEYRFGAKDLGAYEGLTIVAAFGKGLVDIPSVLKVQSYPDYASVFLNGEDTYNDTPHSFRLDSGEYLLEVKKWKYKNYSNNLNLSKGETEVLNVYLQKSPLYIFLETYFPILLFVMGMGWLFLMWWFRGRDPKGRGTIMPFYKAPKVRGDLDGETRELAPGEMGLLIDETAHLHDITGSILGLATKGYLKIKKGEKTKYKWGRNESDYIFVNVKNAVNDGALLDFEKEIFKIIFGKDGAQKEVKLSSLQTKFYKDLPNLKKSLYKRVVDVGYFPKNPDNVRGNYVVGGIIFIVLFLIGGGILSSLLDTPLYLYLLPLIGLAMVIFSDAMPRKTALGVEVYEKVLGYKMFLEVAEKDRIKKLFSPAEYKDIFEENLPYAIVLEVEQEWAKQFKGLYDAVPDWYVGDKNMNDFMTSMHNFSSVAQQAYTYQPAPPSSGSSYKSGGGGWGSGYSGGGSSSWSGGSGSSGGFSGGGFGGGGGSSW